jgi:hypothetical protein
VPVLIRRDLTVQRVREKSHELKAFESRDLIPRSKSREKVHKERNPA